MCQSSSLCLLRNPGDWPLDLPKLIPLGLWTYQAHSSEHLTNFLPGAWIWPAFWKPLANASIAGRSHQFLPVPTGCTQALLTTSGCAGAQCLPTPSSTCAPSVSSMRTCGEFCAPRGHLCPACGGPMGAVGYRSSQGRCLLTRGHRGYHRAMLVTQPGCAGLGEPATVGTDPAVLSKCRISVTEGQLQGCPGCEENKHVSQE